MTRHDSVSTFARSVVGGAVLFGTLFSPESPEDRRRREARAAMFHQGPTVWRGWPGLSPPDYGTERGAPATLTKGDCPAALAAILGAAAWTFFLLVLAAQAWKVFA